MGWDVLLFKMSGCARLAAAGARSSFLSSNNAHEGMRRENGRLRGSSGCRGRKTSGRRPEAGRVEIARVKQAVSLTGMLLFAMKNDGRCFEMTMAIVMPETVACAPQRSERCLCVGGVES